jgi:hypothetical protein
LTAVVNNATAEKIRKFFAEQDSATEGAEFPILR